MGAERKIKTIPLITMMYVISANEGSIRPSGLPGLMQSRD
jgi:hypothetical protein